MTIVKALEWYRQPPYHVARVFGNLYAIEVWDGGVTLSGIIGRKEFSDFNSAKAAAQADYEARILSALTPASDLQAENERLRAALEWYGEQAAATFRLKAIPEALVAIVAALSLDSGKRAKAALERA